jgi:hypothetical protein
MTPEEIKNESMRVLKAKEIEEVDKKVEKDMIELTILKAAEYQKEIKTWKNREVVKKDIKTGDLVLKRKKNWENPGKFQESWEGPYIAKETNMPGAFRLLNQTSEELPYSWNTDSLKRLLTPKFGIGESWICGPNLVKNLVWRRKISSEDSAEGLAVGSLLPFGKGTVCADFTGLRGDVARAEGTNGWISIRTWAIN